jgi:hypothetical protein
VRWGANDGPDTKNRIRERMHGDSPLYKVSTVRGGSRESPAGKAARRLIWPTRIWRGCCLRDRGQPSFARNLRAEVTPANKSWPPPGLDSRVRCPIRD